MFLYKYFNLDVNATEEEIKEKYRKLAKQYHPDVARGEQNKSFENVSKVYNILIDESKKQIYDKSFESKDNHSLTDEQLKTMKKNWKESQLKDEIDSLYSNSETTINQDTLFINWINEYVVNEQVTEKELYKIIGNNENIHDKFNARSSKYKYNNGKNVQTNQIVNHMKVVFGLIILSAIILLVLFLDTYPNSWSQKPNESNYGDQEIVDWIFNFKSPLGTDEYFVGYAYDEIYQKENVNKICLIVGAEAKLMTQKPDNKNEDTVYNTSIHNFKVGYHNPLNSMELNSSDCKYLSNEFAIENNNYINFVDGQSKYFVYEIYNHELDALKEIDFKYNDNLISKLIFED